MTRTLRSDKAITPESYLETNKKHNYQHMKDISNTTERVQFALKQMKKAMPNVKAQVAVYEKNLLLDTNEKKPFIAPQFKNA